jgi:uncharacterized SAM-binding protein YcdF (DUF218 family)
VSYGIEWLVGVAVIGAVAALWVPSFALIALLVAMLATLMALAALAGAILATPYLLGRSILRRLQARHAAGQPNAALTRPGLRPARSDQAAQDVRVVPSEGGESDIREHLAALHRRQWRTPERRRMTRWHSV